MKDYTPSKGLVFILFILLQIVFMLRVSAQDERDYRKIFTGELKPEATPDKEYKYIFTSAAYQLDIDDDGFFESIYLIKKDGLDFIEVKNFENHTVFSGRLYSYGGNSNIYKLTKTKLSEETNALILHYYEGSTDAKSFEGTARVYVLSVDKTKRFWSLAKGPHYWQEHEEVKNRYWQRDYQININDFDKDGVKEISVSYNHIHRIMKYLGRGKWDIN